MDPVQVDQLGLFDGAWPAGLTYRGEFLSTADEAELLQLIAAAPFAEATYKDYKARRRVVSFGGRYDFAALRLEPAAPIPAFLWPLRARVAAAMAVAEDELQHALISEYRPGTPLGWHRDVPEYEEIAGVSLASAATMRLRRYPPESGRAQPVMSLALAARSLYVMRGEARWQWQHRIDPTPALRYSITFRTRRKS